MSRARYPVGKGYLIWQLAACAGGDPARLAAAAAAAGLSWVAIKLHDGPTPHANTRLQLGECVAALRAAGISVWGWGYVYARLPIGEAQTAARLTLEYGLDGYLIDAEHEYKHKRAQTAAFCAQLRLNLPAHPVGFCSYRFPDSHNEIDWPTFLGICDFHAPQVYWLELSSPTVPAQQLRRSVGQLRARRDLPVVPIGVASPNDPDTWRPTVAQLDSFDAAARELGLPGVGWWSWQHAERVDPDWWAAIARHPGGAPSPAPAPAEDALAALLAADVEAILAQTARVRARLAGHA